MEATIVSDSIKHYPVLLKEIISVITPQHGGTFIDCTFGQGGYTKKILNYKNTILYKQLIENVKDKNDAESKIIMFKKIVNSYENFKKYLESDMIINYTYLWDIICKPNSMLFPNGINLIILEIKKDDITSNVSVICPSNHYSSLLFDINKRSTILIKPPILVAPTLIQNNLY